MLPLSDAPPSNHLANFSIEGMSAIRRFPTWSFPRPSGSAVAGKGIPLLAGPAKLAGLSTVVSMVRITGRPLARASSA